MAPVVIAAPFGTPRRPKSIREHGTAMKPERFSTVWPTKHRLYKGPRTQSKLRKELSNRLKALSLRRSVFLKTTAKIFVIICSV